MFHHQQHLAGDSVWVKSCGIHYYIQTHPLVMHSLTLLKRPLMKEEGILSRLGGMHGLRSHYGTYHLCQKRKRSGLQIIREAALIRPSIEVEADWTGFL